MKNQKSKTRQKSKATINLPEGAAEVWAQCNKLWPSEEAAVEAAFKGLRHSTRCPNCNSTEFSHKYGERQVKCKGCRRPYSFTANTFFHGVHSIFPYLVAMRFKEEQIGINHMQLQSLIKGWYSKAWTIAHKVMHVVAHILPDGSVELHQRLLESLVSKRSRETPARCHPRQEPSPREPPEPAVVAPEEFSAEELELLTPEGKKVWDLLGDQYVHCDEIALRIGSDGFALGGMLSMLEQFGKLQSYGDWYKRKAPDPQAVCLQKALNRLENRLTKDQLTEFLGAIKNSIATTHKGISKKLIQHYVAAWGYGAEQGTLLKACIDFGPVSPVRLRDYVSPPVMKLFPIPELAGC
jgi:hypothetical protein